VVARKVQKVETNWGAGRFKCHLGGTINTAGVIPLLKTESFYYGEREQGRRKNNVVDKGEWTDTVIGGGSTKPNSSLETSIILPEGTFVNWRGKERGREIHEEGGLGLRSRRGGNKAEFRTAPRTG